MSSYQQKFIVQELENYEFIFPNQLGDIGFTQNLKEAGQYENYEDAFNAGLEEIGGHFQIFSLYIREE
ncbi:hypothetical protein NEILACOT_05677 [Neisseria lactamica ATCC 23970]|uniref:Phage associated protein n=2 Tax=Neisseria lactamica TaxID=486 RepID=E4ZDS1_NEIL0|nr:hypothetical protein [Neisseria lactamica]EEZ74304.1 hypothetical protein NEILACOT_05677 [Neisseria lactamica ATCC 23970]KFJ35656.1 hypothetical protein DR91_906 [Neisseria lactamica ATCC 23970]KFJ35878.1 hypothetical protein DR91_457 [Neisseria lactamica ATCC 23970]CBN87505.1 conserved hypothetical protein [Neisseria lactamica 020-06]VTQ48342.1 phage associated protein [Neisseria lactamica]